MTKHGPGKARILKRMVISEISLVDRPASRGAMVALYKRDDSQPEDDDMTQKTAEELAKALGTADDENKALRKQLEASTASVATLTAEVADLKKKLEDAETLAKSAGAAAQSDDDIIKGIADPAQRALFARLKKQADDSAEALAKSADEALTKRYVDHAKEFEHLTVEAAKFGPVLKRFAAREATADDMTELLRVLKAADAAVAEGAITKSVGHAGGGKLASMSKRDQAEAKLEELTKAAMVADKSLGYAAAYAKVLKENPDLYTPTTEAA